MLNRSQIMKDAWNRYRICNRGRSFDRRAFAFSLGCAWDAAKAAMMSPAERRRVAIEAEIELLEYRPARQNIEPMRRRLQTELNHCVP